MVKRGLPVLAVATILSSGTLAHASAHARSSACNTIAYAVWRDGDHAVGSGHQYCPESIHHVSAYLLENTHAKGWVVRAASATRTWGPGKHLHVYAKARCTYWGTQASKRWWQIRVTGYWWDGPQDVWRYWVSSKQALIKCA